MKNRRGLLTLLGIVLMVSIGYYCWKNDSAGRGERYPRVEGKYEINSPEWSRSILDDYVGGNQDFETGPYHKEIDDSGEYESGVVNWFTVTVPEAYRREGYEQLFSEMEERVNKTLGGEPYIVRSSEIPLDQLEAILAKGPKDFFDPHGNHGKYVGFLASLGGSGGRLIFDTKSGLGFFQNMIDY